MGDFRTYDYAVAIRASPETVDFIRQQKRVR